MQTLSHTRDSYSLIAVATKGCWANAGSLLEQTYCRGKLAGYYNVEQPIVKETKGLPSSPQQTATKTKWCKA